MVGEIEELEDTIRDLNEDYEGLRREHLALRNKYEKLRLSCGERPPYQEVFCLRCDHWWVLGTSWNTACPKCGATDWDTGGE